MPRNAPTTAKRQPRGWHYRELQSKGLESYQAVCGHYIPKGSYVCQDCNLAPFTEWLQLRERLIEVTDCLEAQPRLNKDTVAAIARARALVESLD